MRFLLAVAAAAALASCDNVPAGRDPSGPVSSGEGGKSAAGRTVPAKPKTAGDLPHASEGLRFVGNWAADERSCKSAAWRFTETSLQTPAGSNCSFNRLTEVPGGYDIRATCTAEAPPASDTLTIRFDESAKSMLFESETIADAGLVFCGREA